MPWIGDSPDARCGALPRRTVRSRCPGASVTTSVTGPCSQPPGSVRRPPSRHRDTRSGDPAPSSVHPPYDLTADGYAGPRPTCHVPVPRSMSSHRAPHTSPRRVTGRARQVLGRRTSPASVLSRASDRNAPGSSRRPGGAVRWSRPVEAGRRSSGHAPGCRRARRHRSTAEGPRAGSSPSWGTSRRPASPRRPPAPGRGERPRGAVRDDRSRDVSADDGLVAVQGRTASSGAACA